MMIHLFISLMLLTSTALAADVDPSLCRGIDDTTRHLVPAQLHPWYRFEHAVRACPAYSKRQTFLWWIITVDLEAEPEVLMSDPILHPRNPDAFTRRGWPRPYIIDRTGHELGRLSDAFPTGGEPSRTESLLSQWVDDFPRQIVIKVFNARVRGDFSAPPLQWNIRTGHYDQIGKGLFDDDP